MTQRFHSDIFDHGLSHIGDLIAASNSLTLHVIKAYAADDVYATVSGNSLGSVPLAGADLALGTSATGRKVQVAAQQITAAANSGAAPDLHIALLDDTNGTVLVVTDEISNQVILTGNVITVPTWAFGLNQPA